MLKPELIAPAGNLDKLRYALEYGADAAYFGIPEFSLRARINRFNFQTLKKGIKYAHFRQKKAYVTFNIYGHNRHIKKLPAYIKKLKKIKPDALIISDPGILFTVKKIWPKAKIHLSTQANVTNWQAAKFWYQRGVKRIVLARECTLKEIKEIHRKVPGLELEYFVHGAMCMSYSGRCILSKYFTDKSANLGDCTQPCRWRYRISDLSAKQYFLEEAQRPGDYLPIEEDRHGTYILNSKDLCLIKYLDKLQQAGISSFKIEGRAKSIYYVSAIVKAYRQAIQELRIKNKELRIKNLNKLFSEIQKTANRGFTTGFLFGKDKFENRLDSSHSTCDYIFVGEVERVQSPKPKVKSRIPKNNYFIYIKPHNTLQTGDKIEIIQPKGGNIRLTIKKMIDIKTNNEIQKAHGGAGTVIKIEANKPVEIMSLLRKKLDKHTRK
jgi:putative protease